MKEKKDYNFRNISGFVLFSEIQKIIKKNVVKIIIISILGFFLANIYFFKFFLDPYYKTNNIITLDRHLINNDLTFWNEMKIFLENNNKFEILFLDFGESYLEFKVKDQKNPIKLYKNNFVIKTHKKITLNYLINSKNSKRLREDLIIKNNLYVDNLVKNFFSYYKLKVISDHEIDKSDINSSISEVLKTLLPPPTPNALDEISIENFQFSLNFLLKHKEFLQSFDNKKKLYYVKTGIKVNMTTETKYPILFLILLSTLFIIFVNTIFILFLIFRIISNVK
jgi:hypothetical protein